MKRELKVLLERKSHADASWDRIYFKTMKEGLNIEEVWSAMAICNAADQALIDYRRYNPD